MSAVDRKSQGGYALRRVRKILIVDDDESQRRLFSRRLSIEKFDILTATSGFDALARIKTLRPDVVLADISMPKIDGIQMLKIMRSSPQTATIPVILMTGLPVPESLLKAAADGLRAGPIHVKGDFQTLFDRINNILGMPASVAPADGEGHMLHKGPVSVDLIHREVVVAGRQVPRLSAKRFDLLLSLLRHEGPVDQDKLLNDVWGHKGDLKSVQMTVARLREDLRVFPALQIKTDAHSYELVIASLPTQVDR